jgi:hypothetical protein
MHFYMHSYLHKNFILVKSGCYSKEVIARLKELCKVKEEVKFETRLKEMEKVLNNDAKAWLFEQLPKESK